MAVNTIPTYSKAGKISWVKLTTANTATDGTWTVWELVPAVWADWARLIKIRIQHLWNNVQTVLRVFINNGGANSTATNNTLIATKTIPQQTSFSQTTATAWLELPDLIGFGTVVDPNVFPVVLPAWYRVLVTIGTTVASGLQITAFLGDLTA
jgi:hypothetical protein